MPSVTALLGPTNTGKTYHAMERMLAHRTGMIGFPLRLLARENYDRLVAARGPERVALVTGEERIVPRSPAYFLCTVEAMPLDRRVDFLAIDEIQLCADRERGHVFTDRLLHARGLEETMFLGAATIKPLLRQLVPEAAVIGRPRLSTLSYSPPRKIARLPRRTAIVVFSVADLYEVADRVRRETGGAALVFGALSPRTRNAQVALYQGGEVDYLVATDAIGMGLNLDIDHVAFTGLVKFDGTAPRALRPAEVAQIAGRAGRYVRNGTFGPTADLGPFDADLVTAVEEHRFAPLEALSWRNSDLVFTSPGALLQSLERKPPVPQLRRARDADDHRALAVLAADPGIAALARSPEAVRLLWEVCQVPDFRNVLTDAHTRLLSQIYRHLQRPSGSLPEDWVASQVAALDRVDGDTDALLARISHIRTWTYVSHRPAWLADPGQWQQRTRAVEDRLSDALHERLTEQFVDRRASVVARFGPDEMVVEVTAGGDVLVQGLPAGRMEGFAYQEDATLRETASRFRGVANRALRGHIADRVRAFAEEPDGAFTAGPDGRIRWRGAAVARLVATDDPLAPRVEPLPSDLLDAPLKERVRRRLAAWVDAQRERHFGPLLVASATVTSGTLRGVLFAVSQGLGSVPRRDINRLVATLTPEDRRELGRLGLSLGRFNVYFSSLLSPDALRWRALLHALRQPGPVPAPLGAPSLPADPAVSSATWSACGYFLTGPRAVRVDRLERFAAAARAAARNGAFDATREMLAAVAAGPDEVRGMLAAIGFPPDGEGRHRAAQARGRATVRS
jgi:ATP-dependent RNA helicase SUPV3L1/SUV3